MQCFILTRSILKDIIYILVFLFLATTSCKKERTGLTEQQLSGWELASQIEKNIVTPKFPDKQFNILDFGAKDSTMVLNSDAIAKAIEACSASGGGKVIVPKGVYYTGPIHLLDNVNLHLEEGAELRFSTDPDDYLPVVHTSFEGTEFMNYSPLIYAKGKKNIAITGKGILNGQANEEFWWPWSGKDTYGWKEGQPSQRDSICRDRLIKLAEDNKPAEERIFGKGYQLRPSFIEPFECENVLIRDVKIINAPFWVIHPFKSNNITVDGVTVESHGPNNDGCDPEYSKNVIIRNCVFNTGDDCIAIKSGRNEDGRRVGIKSENIIVKDCKMIDGHGGVVMGSEISAGVRNVFVENCEMDSPNLDRAIRIKSNSKRGGLVENVFVRNLEVGQVKEAVLKINMFYATYNNQQGNFIPSVKNVNLEKIRVKNGGFYAILAKGYEQDPIENITLNDVIIEKVDKPFLLENVVNLKLIDTYINGSLMQSP
ncbi:MAG: glycoside hydrolase family 28 protein [Flavobacteriaceae bacterium]|nr:glycoside hydrolase family 28 protein [Flavobacteriaceae bacterium]